jgi:hypothetical protein
VGLVVVEVGEHLLLVFIHQGLVRPVRELRAVLGLEHRTSVAVAAARELVGWIHPMRMRAMVVTAVIGQ